MAFSLTGPSSGYDPGFSLPTATLPKVALPSSAFKGAAPAAAGGGFMSGLTGVLGGVGGLLSGGLGSILGGVLGPEPPSNVLSGLGDNNAGGINVGSKVVGSGSAATTIPGQPSGSGGGFYTDNSASAGMPVPSWVAPVLIAGGALALFLLVLPKRK